jgi:hypothetical protein
MAAVRLRKAFRYPEESEGEREELDEEQQERVIEQLQSQNDARNVLAHKRRKKICTLYWALRASFWLCNCSMTRSCCFSFFYEQGRMLNISPDDFYCTSSAGCYSICAFGHRLLAFTIWVERKTFHDIGRCQQRGKTEEREQSFTERIARLHAALVPGTSAVCLLLAVVYLSTEPSNATHPVLSL